MRKSLISLLSAMAVFGVAAAPGNAAILTLGTSEQGWIDQNDNGNGNGNTNNYLVGNCGTNDCRVGEFRNFFGFSIPTLTGNVVSASLVINTALVIMGQSPSLTVQFTSLNTTNSFAALGTGTFYASITYTPSDAFLTETITLNAAALADIAAAEGGIFLVGGRDISPTTFGPTAPDQLVYGSSGGPQQLVITTAEQQVPEPGSLSLLGAALLGVGVFRRRFRRIKG